MDVRQRGGVHACPANGCIVRAAAADIDGRLLMRYAVYFCPAPASALAALGRDWLSGELAAHGISGIPLTRWNAMLADVRRYGWHATLRSPFTLSPDVDLNDLRQALQVVARSHAPINLPLRCARLAGFPALRPVGDCKAVNALAAACIEAVEPLRLPLAETDFQRRASGLDAIETHYLGRYGYPYVFERYRFHMTLSAPASVEEERALQRWLSLRASMLPTARLDALTLCVEPSPGAAFEPLERIALQKVSVA
jgi:2'-5' RNA ligase